MVAFFCSSTNSSSMQVDEFVNLCILPFCPIIFFIVDLFYFVCYFLLERKGCCRVGLAELDWNCSHYSLCSCTIHGIIDLLQKKIHGFCTLFLLSIVLLKMCDKFHPRDLEIRQTELANDGLVWSDCHRCFSVIKLNRNQRWRPWLRGKDEPN